MRLTSALLLAGLLFVPPAAWAVAEIGKVRCTIPHFLRFPSSSGTEIRSSVVVFNNGDLVNPTTIQRFTIQNFFGGVVHDSGPAVGVPHPLNTDFTSPVDITVVPPGATFYLTTNHIWDNTEVTGGNEQGFAMSAVVEFSKEGGRDLFSVRGRARTRQRIQISPGVFGQGIELSSNLLHCFTLK